MPGVLIHPDDFDRIDDAVQRSEQAADPVGPLDPSTLRRPDPRAMLRVVLLHDLLDGRTALARVTAFRRSPVGWDVAAVGDIDALSAWSLQVRVGGGVVQESDPVGMFATAADVRTALRPINAAGPVEVGLGAAVHPQTGARQTVEAEAFNPGRWLIHFPRGGPDGDAYPGLETERELRVTLNDQSVGTRDAVILRRSFYVDAGWSVEVHAAIPTGEPTPLRAGAVCTCAQFGGAWGVVSAEARDFDNANLGGYYDDY